MAATSARKAAHQRHDVLHKLSTGLVRDHDGLVIEDLAVAGLANPARKRAGTT